MVESWVWDLNDNMKSHTVPPPRSGASSMTTSYAYDYDDGTTANDYGNLVSVTDPTGRVETRAYYGSGALKSRAWTKSGATTQSSTVWLNSRGFTTKMRDTTGSTNRDTTYVVDRAGQRTKATTSVGSLEYVWDLAGGLREFTQADGSKFRFTHLPTGQLYEFSGYTSSTGVSVLIANYTYDGDGIQTNEWIFSAGGSTRSNSLNAAGKTTTFSEAMKKPDGSWENYTSVMGYRADQRLGSEQVNGGTAASMAYDNAGQLTAQSGTAATGFTYGTRGNRLTSTAGGATTTYTTNPNGSVASTTKGSTVVTYDYDDAGRRTLATTKVSGTTTRTVATSYDARGKPSTITDTAGSNVTTETRTYDGGSQLTDFTVTIGSTTDTYQAIWDTTTAIPRAAETKRNGSTWIRSDYGNELLAFKSGFYPSWYKLDARMSVLNPDNNTNNPPGPTAYDPFGKPTGATYIATGYRGEAHFGDLIHLRNRDYDPTIGQFTTQDELDGVDGSPTASNSYHYGRNDPSDRTDPTGLRDHDDTLTPQEQCRKASEYLINAMNGWASGIHCSEALNHDYLIDHDCMDKRWAVRIAINIEEKFLTLHVEPTGLARTTARFMYYRQTDRPWNSTWKCASQAIKELGIVNDGSHPTIYTARESIYRSQYYCHSYAVILGTRWQGGPRWDLEGFRTRDLWDPKDWVSTHCSF